LGDTVLISELWVVFSHLALNGYRYGPGFPSREGPSKQTWLSFWNGLPRMIEHLHSDLPSDRELATYLLGRFSRLDRYRKLALTRFVSPQWIEDIHAVVGRPKWPRLVIFDNVPYLKRFRVGGQVLFVTSDYFPERHHEMEQLDVDTMSLRGDAVLWLSVNGDDAPFDATGHYPILAGYDSSGNPLFVAAVRIEFLCYFAPVAEGASTLTYQDELGDEHVSHGFFVLALRHNPSDISPPYPRARAGAMDPTGPLYWLRCWPERDPEYFEDELLEGDDRRFESALSGITSWGVADSERTKSDMSDTVLEDGVDSDIARSL